VHRRLALSCASAATALALTACGGGAPSASKEVAAAHPTWVAVAQIACPSGSDPSGSVDSKKVTCSDERGHAVEAAFYDERVDLDRRVSTLECKTGVKAVAGTDWIVPAVTDQAVVAQLLDAGGINLC
jgi:hypothetical protein